jgi:hypothetical protein
MFLIVHTAAATVISQHTSHPMLLFLYAFFSHFILDFIPHGDEKLVGQSNNRTIQFKRLFLAATLDGFLIFLFSIYYLLVFAPVHYGLFFIAMGGAMIPDLISGLSFVLNGHFNKQYPLLAKFQKLHKTVHTFFERKLNLLIPLSYGIVWQAFVFLTFLTLLKK